jgi:hypothetical protein
LLPQISTTLYQCPGFNYVSSSNLKDAFKDFSHKIDEKLDGLANNINTLNSGLYDLHCTVDRILDAFNPINSKPLSDLTCELY